MDTTSQQLRDGARELGNVDVDRTGVPPDVVDLARGTAAYARIVAGALDDGITDAGAVTDILNLGEVVAKHAALTDAAGEGRPAIRLVAAAARWLIYAAQLPLVEFPVGAGTIATAVEESTRRVRLAVVAPDAAPEAWCTVHGCSSIAPCPKHAAATAGVL